MNQKERNVWEPPETAPRDGSFIIADIGFCFCPAVWSHTKERFIFVAPEYSDGSHIEPPSVIGLVEDTDKFMFRWFPWPVADAAGTSEAVRRAYNESKKSQL